MNKWKNEMSTGCLHRSHHSCSEAGGKLFNAAVTLGDSQFLGSGAAIITAATEPYLAAPLVNCWLDLAADGEVDIVTRIHFANLVTGGLAVSKTGKISKHYLISHK